MLEKRFKKITSVGPTGSEPVEAKELDEEIMQHFLQLETTNPMYLRSSITGAQCNYIFYFSIFYYFIKYDCKHHTSPYKVDFEREVYTWVLDSVKEKKNSEDNGDKDIENGNAEPKIVSSRGY